MTLSRRQAVGQEGERTATDFLRRRGYRIEARHLRTPFGEIDIVARKRAAYVFVEVKTRRSDFCGEALGAVSAVQRRRIVRGALWYVAGVCATMPDMRFAVIGIDGTSAQKVRMAFVEDVFDGGERSGFSF